MPRYPTVPRLICGAALFVLALSMLADACQTTVTTTVTPVATATPSPTATATATATPVPPPPATVVVSYDNHVYGLDPGTGARRWSYTAPAGVPVMADGRTYVVEAAGLFGNRGYIHAFDAATGPAGPAAWAYQNHDDDYGPTVVDGVAYVGANRDGVYALRDNGGASYTFLWHARPGTRLNSKSIPAAAGGLVYIGEGDNHVYALKASDGTISWSFPTPNYVDASPQVVNGVVYVGTVGCSAGACDYALNATTGAQLWRTAVGGGGSGNDRDLRVRNGVIYGTYTGGVYALNAQDGTVRWRSSVGGDFLLADDTALYVESAEDVADNSITVINLADRSTRWRLQDASTIYTLLGVEGGVVYVGAQDASSKAEDIRALRADDGSTIWSTQVVAPQPAATPGQ